MAAPWIDTGADVEETIADVQRAKKGDRRAYERLVKRYLRLVTSITLAITTDVDASEDAAQEAFLDGWRDLKRLEKPEAFGAWISQIARNRATDHLRKRTKVVRADDEQLAETPDESPDALEELIDGEQTELIAGALQALPEEARETVILFYREGQSVAQVAETLEVSEDVVKKRLSRAREKMRQSVEAALGSALLATMPAANFGSRIAGGLAGFRWAQKTKVGGRSRLAGGIMKLAAAGAAAAVVVTYVARPPEIRGSIGGAKNVTGVATIDCGIDHRTVKIAHGVFSAKDLPTGTCHMTFALDGLPSPAPQTVRLVRGEVVNVRLQVTKVAAPAPGATPGEPAHKPDGIASPVKWE